MLSTALSPTEAVGTTRRRSIPLPAAIPVAAGAGVASDAAFPALAWWPLAFVGVCLGLLTLVGRGPGGALLVGAVFGAAFHLSHLSWVGSFLGPLPWLALSALQTALFALGAVAIALVYRWADGRSSAGRRPTVTAAAVAVVWTAREVIVGMWPYTGFPWARLGMSQVNGPFAEVASWVGVTGLSLVVATIAALLVELVRERRRSVARVAIPAFVIATAAAVLPQFPTAESGTLRVGWVQGNARTGYFDGAGAGEVFAAQRQATEQITGQVMDLLAWPEGGVDSDPLRGPARAALDELSRDVDAPVLVNAATQRGGLTYNTSLLWTPGSPPKLHDKINPVPFGEYVPDRWFYELLAPDLVGLVQREYAPGVAPPVVNVDGVQVGLAICFDVIYDDVVRAGIDRGAQVLVLQSNNADFRGTDENLQQAAFARMRAIETGRSVVNVSTVGTSQVFAPDGAVLAEASPGVAAAGVTAVPRRTGVTAGVLLGPWVTATVLATAAVAVVTSILRARRRTPPTRYEDLP